MFTAKSLLRLLPPTILLALFTAMSGSMTIFSLELWWFGGISTVMALVFIGLAVVFFGLATLLYAYSVHDFLLDLKEDAREDNDEDVKSETETPEDPTPDAPQSLKDAMDIAEAGFEE